MAQAKSVTVRVTPGKVVGGQREVTVAAEVDKAINGFIQQNGKPEDIKVSALGGIYSDIILITFLGEGFDSEKKKNK